jgi:hypothetical protein
MQSKPRFNQLFCALLRGDSLQHSVVLFQGFLRGRMRDEYPSVNRTPAAEQVTLRVGVLPPVGIL